MPDRKIRRVDIEQTLMSALRRVSPDVLDSVLVRCEEHDRVSAAYLRTASSAGATGLASSAGSTSSAGASSSAGSSSSAGASSFFARMFKSPLAAATRAIGVVAATVAIVIGSTYVAGTISDRTADATITLDVNPSVEIAINQKERVIDVEANNDDAKVILDDMDLMNTHVNVAVNALIGSMLKHGYIQPSANTVLLSVEGKDGTRSSALQKQLTESISMHLNVINGAVLSQTVSDDEAISALADENNVSHGKAALVQKVLNDNSHLLFEDLAKLSVNELFLLIGSKNIQADGLASEGSANDEEFIGEDYATQIAIANAGADIGDITELSSELDFDDGQMVYEVEFYYGGLEYEYEIGAKDGAILEFDTKAERGKMTNGELNGNAGRGEIATNGGAESPDKITVYSNRVDGANGGAAPTDTNASLFDANSQNGAFDVGVDSPTAAPAAIATTTADAASKNESRGENASAASASMFIGEERATRIAVEFLGGPSYANTAVELDKDDGLYIYEIEFVADNSEYEFEIEAVTGEILSWEVDGD